MYVHVYFLYLYTKDKEFNRRRDPLSYQFWMETEVRTRCEESHLITLFKFQRNDVMHANVSCLRGRLFIAMVTLTLQFLNCDLYLYRAQ